MKRNFVKIVISLVICVTMLTCTMISASAASKSYSGEYTKSGKNYFDGQVNGTLYNDTSSSYVYGSTTRESAGSGYSTVYVKVYFEYPDGEYFPSWNTTISSNTVTTSMYDPGYIYPPDDVSSLHTIYNSSVSSAPGQMWLGAHTH